MQGTYVQIHVSGDFERYGIASYKKHTGDKGYAPVIIFKEIKSDDGQVWHNVPFRLAKGFKSLGVLNPGTRVVMTCRYYSQINRVAYPKDIRIDDGREMFPDDDILTMGMIMEKNLVRTDAKVDMSDNAYIKAYEDYIKVKR